MPPHTESIRSQLAHGPIQARQLVERIGLSQPTISRAIAALGDEVVRIGSGPSIQYTLRDTGKGINEVPVYRVNADGHEPWDIEHCRGRLSIFTWRP